MTAEYELQICIDPEYIGDKEKLRQFYENARAQYNGDSGIDLLNPTPLQNVYPFSVHVINFGIKCAMFHIPSAQPTSFLLLPRSSISNTDFMLANSVGLIDAGYRGNLMAKVRWLNLEPLDPAKSSSLDGRYFQIVAPDLKPISVKLVDHLSETERGKSGFGSTGN